MSCNDCLYAMPALVPASTDLSLMQLTCYRRDSPAYLKRATTRCAEFDSLVPPSFTPISDR